MLFSTIAALSLASLAAAAPAPAPEKRSPPRERLYARALVTNPNNSIEAHLEFWGRTDGTGTFTKVEVISGLFDNENSPYAYHIHTNPVGQDLDCTVALGHLDPLNVTESLICDPHFPKFCQEGDLAGKHGKFNGTDNGAISAFGYTDDYLRFFPEEFSILGRSVVIHSAINNTRLACGNIISTLDGTADSMLQPTWKPSSFVTHYPTEPPFNPAQVITPIVGEVLPSESVLQNLPFPLPNPAIPLKNATNVALSIVTQTVFINGQPTQTPMPVESPSNDPAPFSGFTDSSWSW